MSGRDTRMFTDTTRCILNEPTFANMLWGADAWHERFHRGCSDHVLVKGFDRCNRHTSLLYKLISPVKRLETGRYGTASAKTVVARVFSLKAHDRNPMICRVSCGEGVETFERVVAIKSAPKLYQSGLPSCRKIKALYNGAPGRLIFRIPIAGMRGRTICCIASLTLVLHRFSLPKVQYRKPAGPRQQTKATPRRWDPFATTPAQGA